MSGDDHHRAILDAIAAVRDDIRQDRTQTARQIDQVHKRIDKIDERLRSSVHHDDFRALEVVCTGGQKISDTDRVQRSGWGRIFRACESNPAATLLGFLLLLMTALVVVAFFGVQANELNPWR